MKKLVIIVGSICISILLVMGCAKKIDYSKMQTGMVRYISIEGGFYGIYGEKGEHLDPVNLPVKFQKDSLRIRFTAVEHKEMVSFHMWGKLIEIKDIELLEQ